MLLSEPARSRIWFIVESGTDVRLVDALAERFDLTLFARRIVNGVEVSRAPSSKFTMRVGSPSVGGFAREVFGALRRERDTVDFVLVQGYGPAAAAANAAMRLARVPGAMLVCSPTEEYYRWRRSNPVAGRPFRRRELVALQALARVNARLGSSYIVLSDYLADTVRGHGTSGRVDVIPVYGVDTRVFRPLGRDRQALRLERGLPENASVLFFSSRVAPEKDSVTLIKAVRELRSSGRDLRILHRSGGYREFESLAAAHGVGDAVIATDAVHPCELPLDYCAVDLCVQASHAEGLGYSVLEALACGTPVVATAVGGLKETIVDGQTGWSCAPGNVAALAGAVASALDDPSEAARRTERGRQMVIERFDTRHVFPRLAARIEDAARRRGRVA